MVGKRGVSEDLYGTALQRRRARVKAGWPAPQGPGVARHTRRAQVWYPRRPREPQVAVVLGVRRARGTRRSERMHGQAWGTYGARVTVLRQRNRGSPMGRAPQGDGVPRVLVGVTAHPGARESRAQGEVAPGAGGPGAVRSACCGAPKQDGSSCARGLEKATGELSDTERVTISSEGGRWKHAGVVGHALAAYPTSRTVLRGARGLVTVLGAGNGPRLPGARARMDIQGDRVCSPSA